MNTLFHKLALYTASILISSLPFTTMVAEADDKVKNNTLQKSAIQKQRQPTLPNH